MGLRFPSNSLHKNWYSFWWGRKELLSQTQHYSYFFRVYSFKLKIKNKLENCVCKTQVMPRALSQSLPIALSSPMTINTFNQYWRLMSEMTTSKLQFFVKNYIFVCKIKHAHLQYAFNSCAKFQNECLKILRAVDYTI